MATGNARGGTPRRSAAVLLAGVFAIGLAGLRETARAGRFCSSRRWGSLRWP